MNFSEPLLSLQNSIQAGTGFLVLKFRRKEMERLKNINQIYFHYTLLIVYFKNAPFNLSVLNFLQIRPYYKQRLSGSSKKQTRFKVSISKITELLYLLVQYGKTMFSVFKSCDE